MNRTAWHVIACMTALLLFSTSSRAQSPATTFNELRQVLRPGEQVIVTHANGTLVGLGIGAGLGIAGCMAPKERDSCSSVFYTPVVFAALMGGLSGAFVDAALRKTVYRAGTPNGGSTIVVSPLINTKATGALLRFKVGDGL